MRIHIVQARLFKPLIKVEEPLTSALFALKSSCKQVKQKWTWHVFSIILRVWGTSEKETKLQAKEGKQKK